MSIDILKADYLRNKAAWYATLWIGTPYTWGGDDFRSLDCSGLIVEIFKALGCFKEDEDFSADQIFAKFETKRIRGLPYAGCLSFWLNSAGKAVHVGIMIDNIFMVHAAGGGSKTKTIEDAIRDNAFIKMRPLEEVGLYRKKHYNQDYVICDPFKETR